jgi:8-oxo-dGTP pyrophosphatase MutT (NUDIX family)
VTDLIRPASTIILLDGADDEPPRVYMLRRARAASFSNAYVFPGGALDPDDATLAARHGPDPDALIAHQIAAARELFEEAGLLLTHTPLSSDSLTQARAALLSDQLRFNDLLDHHLHAPLDLSSLTCFARWVTPPNERKRYDTRFFIARRSGQGLLCADGSETHDGRWVTPREMIDAYEASQIKLVPPTRIVLEQLDRAGSCAQIIRWARSLMVHPIEPQPLIIEQEIFLTLPGDPDHLGPTDAADLGLPVTRMAYRDERWWLCS